MFGNYCVYLERTPVSLICDNQLFIKPTKEGEEFLQQFGVIEKGHPFPGAKLWILFEDFEDEEGFRTILEITEKSIKKTLL